MSSDKIDFTQPFEALKTYFQCAKCETQNIRIPIVLKRCRHIFCTKCIVIQGKQPCPKCQTLYRPADVDRENVFVKNCLDWIKQIDVQHPEQLTGSTPRYSLDLTNADKDYLLKTALPNWQNALERFGFTEEETECQNNEMEVETDAKEDDNLPSVEVAHDEISIDFEEFKNVTIYKGQLKRNAKGETLLHLACKKGDFNAVQKLLTEGTDVNCVDWANWTPLHEAVQINDLKSAELLLEAGCLVNVPAENYTTPLHQAATAGNQEMIELLLKHSADPHALDLHGNRASDSYPSLQSASTSRSDKGKSLVFNTNSAKCGPKITSLTALSLLSNRQLANNMEYFPIDDKISLNKENLFTAEILACLLKALPVIRASHVENSLQSETLDFLKYIPPVLWPGYKKSLKNRLLRLPKLLDKINIHLSSQLRDFTVSNCSFTRSELQGLIEIAGGTILKRAPSESTVEGAKTRPFHAQNSSALKECAHYIVYNEAAPPLLRYNMKELRHVSAQWLVNCLWDFEITWV